MQNTVSRRQMLSTAMGAVAASAIAIPVAVAAEPEKSFEERMADHMSAAMAGMNEKTPGEYRWMVDHEVGIAVIVRDSKVGA